MRIEVDWTRCDGHGLCALLAPANVNIDAAGFPVVVAPDVADDDVRAARQAAAACPALALRVQRR